MAWHSRKTASPTPAWERRNPLKPLGLKALRNLGLACPNCHLLIFGYYKTPRVNVRVPQTTGNNQNRLFGHFVFFLDPVETVYTRLDLIFLFQLSLRQQLIPII